MTDTAEHVADPAIVAAQNDRFRRETCLGRPLKGTPILQGSLVCTAAIAARGQPFVLACLAAVGSVTDFPADNDPDGHHDFGSVEVTGETVWFKIDLYDGPGLEYGAEAPDDPSRTYRVLTILFPSDW